MKITRGDFGNRCNRSGMDHFWVIPGQFELFFDLMSWKFTRFFFTKCNHQPANNPRKKLDRYVFKKKLAKSKKIVKVVSFIEL